MSTDTPGTPQPSGADEPIRSATPSTEQQSVQPTGRTEGEQDAERTAEQAPAHPATQDTQHLTEQPTQQMPSTPPAPPTQGQAQGHAPAQHPQYGQMASGSPYYAQQQPASPQQPGSQPHQHQGQPYAQASSGQGGGPGNPYAYHQAPAPAGGPGGASAKAARQRSVWVPVTSAAVIAAVLASLGTAAATGAFDADSPTSLANVGSSSREADEAPVTNSTSSNPNWEKVTTAVAPSVVAIQVQSQSGGGEGSGVVYDGDGHILTNNHVVEGAETVQVTMSDGRMYEAEIVGTDPTTDLAVVQLQDPPDDLQPASFGDAEDVVVGDAVLAVGNPLGLANTATTGIVSALDRPVSASGEDGSTQVVTNAIQIDAAINPGNSGGPLFNAQGQVIGITSSIASLSSGMSGGQSGSIGLGFAIPVNLAANIADQLIADGTAEHAFLGVTMQDATADADGVTRRGAEVIEVSPGSPAAEAGLQAGDVIVAIGDDAVNGAESLTAYVREEAADENVTLTFVRDGKTQTVDVTLAVKEESATGQGEQGQGGQDGQGQGEQGQGDQDGQGQNGQDGQGGGSDSTSPDNLPDWLQDMLEGNN